MELITNLGIGFGVALTLQNLFYCFGGVLLGTLIGVLPGIGPVPTIAMLLPITYALPPVSALIMLAGIYYGAQYGGSTTAILVNLPGEASSVVTCLDGYQMARQGKAGKALAIAAIGSFKPLLIVLGSVIVFAMAAPKLGLIVATILLIVLSSTASHEFRWKEAVIASLALSVFTLAAFVYGLKLQLPTWPWFIQ